MSLPSSLSYLTGHQFSSKIRDGTTMFKITIGISPERTANAEETGHNTGDQRWKSQRDEINRLAYSSLLGIAYVFLSQIPRFLVIWQSQTFENVVEILKSIGRFSL
jgi:hypothetical protein